MPPPEGKSPWLIVIGILVIGLVVGMVAISFASGARTFNGMGAIFPVISILGIGAMLFGGRFGGGGQQMSTRKARRAARPLPPGARRAARPGLQTADDLDSNYRWYHPPVDTLTTAVGGPRMWERNPNGKDTWFGVARVGVGMTSLVEGGAVTFSEPDDMPTEIELEPATGKALQEFVRYQSVAYGTPALISLLVEPGYRITGERPVSLALMRAIIAQLVFSHGPDHLQLVVVTDDTRRVGVGEVAAAQRKSAPSTTAPGQRAWCTRRWRSSRTASSLMQCAAVVRSCHATPPAATLWRPCRTPWWSVTSLRWLVFGDDVDRGAGMDVLRRPRRGAGLPG